MKFNPANPFLLTADEQGFLYLVIGQHGKPMMRTASDIRRGEAIIELIGEITNKKEVSWGYVGNAFTVDQTVSGNKARFISDSLTPNMIALTFIRNQKPAVILFALRNITANEELTLSYTMKPSLELYCNYHTEATSLMKWMRINSGYYLRNCPISYRPPEQSRQHQQRLPSIDPDLFIDDEQHLLEYGLNVRKIHFGSNTQAL